MIALAILNCGYLADTPIVDPHAWRQSDVLAHILSFTGYKDMLAFSTFDYDRKVFDIPIYQLLILCISKVLGSSVLPVTRMFGAACLALSLFAVYQIFSGKDQARKFLLFSLFFCLSPYISHYYSTPHPDPFAITLCLLGLALLYSYGMKTTLALPFFIVATLIKSPIVFVFSIFIFLNFRKEKGIYRLGFILFVAALLAEICRHILNLVYIPENMRNSFDPEWYFGSLDLRMSSEYWKTLFIRLRKGSSYAFALAFIFCLFKGKSILKGTSTTLVISAFMCYLVPWLVFANLYKIHSYYLLPSLTLAYLAMSIVLSSLYSRKSFIPIISLFLIVSIWQIFNKRVFFADKNLDRVSSFAYLLKNSKSLLYVKSKSFDPAVEGPIFAGQVATPTKYIQPKLWKKSCDFYMAKFSSIYVEKDKTYRADKKCQLELGNTSFKYQLRTTDYELYIK